MAMATAFTEITELKTNTLGENTFQSHTQTEAGMAAQARWVFAGLYHKLYYFYAWLKNS